MAKLPFSFPVDSWIQVGRVSLEVGTYHDRQTDAASLLIFAVLLETAAVLLLLVAVVVLMMKYS